MDVSCGVGGAVGGVGTLGAGALVKRAVELLAEERRTAVMFMAYLMEIDRRRLYWGQGASNLYAWMVEKLNMSESGAATRVSVLRVAQQNPELGRRMLEMLADGRLHMSGAAMLARCARHGDMSELLEQAAGKSRGAIERMVAGLAPEAHKRAVVRSVAVQVVVPKGDDEETLSVEIAGRPGQAPPGVSGAGGVSGFGGVIGGGNAAGLSAPGASPLRLVQQVPVTEAVRVSVTLRRSAYDMLHAAMKRGVGRPMETVLERAITLLDERENPLRRAERIAKRLAGAGGDGGAKDGGGKEGTSGEAARSRVPEAVRAMVWARDGGMCTFVGTDGKRCGSREWLQVDHIRPVSRGGTNEIENLRLLCRGHNVSEAVKELGEIVMGRFVECGETNRVGRVEDQ